MGGDLAAWQPKSVVRAILLAYVAVTAVSGLFIVLSDYREGLERARGQAAETALLVEELANGTVRAADLVVRRAVEQLAPGGMPDRLGEAEWRRLVALADDLPQLGLLALVDRDGVLRLTSQGYPFPPHILTDRSFWRAHRDGHAGPFVGPAVVARAGDMTFFTVSRPVFDREGRFDGAVVAGIDLAYFRSLYERVTPGPGGALAVLREDGALLVRHPFSPMLLRPEMGEHVRSWRVFTDFAGQKSGSYEVVRSTADGKTRFVSFRRVAGQPLIVLVMVAHEDVVAGVLPSLLRTAMMGGAILCVMIALAWLAFRLIAREEAASQALLGSNRRLSEALEEAQAGSRAKSLFLANMSHELRTPLNAIIGFTEALQAGYYGRVNERQEEYLGHIRHAGRHLLEVISQVLDLSKVTAGRLEIEAVPTALGPLAESALLMVRHKAVEKGIDLVVDLPADLPVAMLDPLRVRQILINLLANAVKFTPPGGRVKVAAWVEPDEGLLIEVCDNGIGMRPEELPNALDIFGQFASSPTKAHEGTGVGLPLTKALVELHGGTLCIDTELGVGTSATVIFPPDSILPAANGDEGAACA